MKSCLLWCYLAMIAGSKVSWFWCVICGRCISVYRDSSMDVILLVDGLADASDGLLDFFKNSLSVYYTLPPHLTRNIQKMLEQKISQSHNKAWDKACKRCFETLENFTRKVKTLSLLFVCARFWPCKGYFFGQNITQAW